MSIKVWHARFLNDVFFSLPDLSFQAASQIMSTPIYDAIKLMKDISQNFPIKARYSKVYLFDYSQNSFH